MDALTDNIDVQCISRADFLYLEDHSRTRLALHSVAALFCLQILGRNSIDLNDLVTALKAVFLCRRTCIRLVDDDIFSDLLVDDRSDTSVCLGKQHLQILILLLRDVDGVGVQFLQHCVHSGAHYPVYRKGVHIGEVKLLDYRILDFAPLAEFEVLGLS